MSSRQHIIDSLALSLILITVLALSACSSKDELRLAEVAPGEQVSQSSSSDSTALEIEYYAIKPSEESEPDECLECHTDKDRLIKTADPVEDLESESSGEG